MSVVFSVPRSQGTANVYDWRAGYTNGPYTTLRVLYIKDVEATNVSHGVIRTQPSDYRTAGGAVENHCTHYALDGTMHFVPEVFREYESIHHVNIPYRDYVNGPKGVFLYPGYYKHEYTYSEQSLSYKGGTKTLKAQCVLSFEYPHQIRVEYRHGHSASNAIISWSKSVTRVNVETRYIDGYTVNNTYSFEEAPTEKPELYGTFSSQGSTRVALATYDYTCKVQIPRFNWDFPGLASEEISDCLHSLGEANYYNIGESLQKFKSNMLMYSADLLKTKELIKPMVQLVASSGSSITRPQWWASLYLSYYYGIRLTVKDSAELKSAIESELQHPTGTLISTNQKVYIDKPNKKWDAIRRMTGSEKKVAYNAMTEDEQIQCMLYQLARDSSTFLPAFCSVAMAAQKAFPLQTQKFRSRGTASGEDKLGPFNVVRNLTAHVSTNAKTRSLTLWNQFLYEWDIKCSASNIWDMVPFSFVVDWIFNIGDYFDYREKAQAYDIYPIRYLIDSYKIVRPYNIKIDNRWEQNLNCSKYSRAIIDGNTAQWLSIPDFTGFEFSPENLIKHSKEALALLVSNSR